MRRTRPSPMSLRMRRSRAISGAGRAAADARRPSRSSGGTTSSSWHSRAARELRQRRSDGEFAACLDAGRARRRPLRRRVGGIPNKRGRVALPVERARRSAPSGRDHARRGMRGVPRVMVDPAAIGRAGERARLRATRRCCARSWWLAPTSPRRCSRKTACRRSPNVDLSPGPRHVVHKIKLSRRRRRRDRHRPRVWKGQPFAARLRRRTTARRLPRGLGRRGERGRSCGRGDAFR